MQPHEGEDIIDLVGWADGNLAAPKSFLASALLSMAGAISVAVLDVLGALGVLPVLSIFWERLSVA